MNKTRSPEELARALRVRASYLQGDPYEFPVTTAMMKEAADALDRVHAKAYGSAAATAARYGCDQAAYVCARLAAQWAMRMARVG